MTNKLLNKNIILSVSGEDHPGITSALMKSISNHKISLIDMGQAVTHGLLSLSIVIHSGDNEEIFESLLKDLLFITNQNGLNLDYKEIHEVLNQSKDKDDKFILSCVSVEKITSQFVLEIATILAKHEINIQRIDKISPEEMCALEFSTKVPSALEWHKVKEELLLASTVHKVDVAFLRDNVFRRSKRLIVFDMDSTLIQGEVIDELATLHGVGDQVKAITKRAMNGEIDFNESLTQRVSLLKGLEVSKLSDVHKKLPFTPGAEEFIKTVKKLGYKVAVISGGFTFFTDILKDHLSLDYAFANELEMSGGKLTGKVVGPIVNADQKAMLVKLIGQQEGISLEQIVAIGDGANDLPMLATAGLGIAFHAKEIVKKKASQHMSHGPMTSILYFLGIVD